MSLQSDLTTAVAKATTDSGLLHDIVHGDDQTLVQTEGGQVKTVAKAMADIDVQLQSSMAEFDAKVAEAADSASSASASETNAATSEGLAADSAVAAAVSEANAVASENSAAASASAAAASEANAASSETNAAASAVAASLSEANAGASEANAATSETNAGASASAAAASETNAGTSEANAAQSQATALAHEQKAELWAEHDEDLEVEPGRFSARHWARKAQAFAQGGAEFHGFKRAADGSLEWTVAASGTMAVADFDEWALLPVGVTAQFNSLGEMEIRF